MSAAINISSRLDPVVGPDIYVPTVRQHCVGNQLAELADLRGPTVARSAADDRVRAWWWRALRTGPRGELTIDLLRQTDSSATDGALVLRAVTVLWRHGDWRMRLPARPDTLVYSSDGFTEIPQ